MNDDSRSEEVTRDDYERVTAVESGKKVFIRRAYLDFLEKKRKKRRDAIQARINKIKGEKIAPYSDIRSMYLSNISGFIFSAISAVVLFYAFKHRQADAGRLGTELFADFLIVIGTWFSAKGVVLNFAATGWLRRIVEQENIRPGRTRFVRDSTHTRMLIELIHSIATTYPPSLIPQVSSGDNPNDVAGQVMPREAPPKSLHALLHDLRKELDSQRSGFKHLFVISQEDLACVLLDASRTTLYGSSMVIIGTIIMAFLAYK